MRSPCRLSTPLISSFSVWFMSYETKVGDYFFPELRVISHIHRSYGINVWRMSVD
jgi:hypothetical protein